MNRLSCILFLALGLVSGCKQSPAPTAGTDEPRVFQVKGVIQNIERPQKRIVIRHEEIPGYMPAMAMPFEVRDAGELNGLSTNEPITFRLLVTDDRAWIDRIKKLSNAPPATPANAAATNQLQASGSFRRVRDVEPLAVGDLMPDYHFTNELGQPVNLSDFKGQAVALTFIYTRCPLPNFCPQMGRNFAAAYHQLITNHSAVTNWHLLTISFDPTFDTPKALKEYGQRMFKADSARWNFLTGAMIDIDAITEQFGLYFSRQEGSFNWDHNLRTVVIGADGKIKDILIGNQWKPEELVEKLVAAAGKETTNRQ